MKDCKIIIVENNIKLSSLYKTIEAGIVMKLISPSMP